jgi:putative transposase
LPEYRRIRMAGGTFFFTVVTYGRRPMLTTPEVRQALREGIFKARQSMPFNIAAWVLLPDHLHAIWTLPENDHRNAARWAVIKSSVTKKCSNIFNSENNINFSRKNRHESGIWQRRFWEHVVIEDQDFHRHLDYIHWNPVKYGHAEKAMDWPYSTIHRFVAQGLYPADWGGGGIEKILGILGNNDGA